MVHSEHSPEGQPLGGKQSSATVCLSVLTGGTAHRHFVKCSRKVRKRQEGMRYFLPTHGQKQSRRRESINRQVKKAGSGVYNMLLDPKEDCHTYPGLSPPSLVLVAERNHAEVLCTSVTTGQKQPLAFWGILLANASLRLRAEADVDFRYIHALGAHLVIA